MLSSSSSSSSGRVGNGESEVGSTSEGVLEYFGWVYHLGVNSVGHEYCHLRYLLLRGNCVRMYKRDPHEQSPGSIKPIRKGVISHNLVVEEVGLKRLDNGDLYVLKFYSRLDETKKGEIACATAGEARKWMEAFEQAKQRAISELLSKSGRSVLNSENELNLEGHRPRVRRYAHSLKRFIKIGRGPERLLRKSSNLEMDVKATNQLDEDVVDAAEKQLWKCVRAINGIRILENVAGSKSGNGVLVKSIGVVDANLDTVFEMVLSLDRHRRYEWDMLTADLDLVESVDGHYDIVYGTYTASYTRFPGFNSKRDFVFSRQWFRGPDGEYTILQFPTVHKSRPKRSGYRRIKINPSIWEIRKLDHPKASDFEKCLVTLMLELHTSGWGPWKEHKFKKFQNSIPYTLLCQVAGLREYFGANPALTSDASSVIVKAKEPCDLNSTSVEIDDSDTNDEFYDAIAPDSLLDEEDSDDELEFSKGGKLKLKNVSWALAGLAIRKRPDADSMSMLETGIAPIDVDFSQFKGSLLKARGDSDSNCWSSPSGEGFKIRGKNYLKDFLKIIGEEPLLKLLAVDWFKAENKIGHVALNPNCLVQTAAGKKIPFILVLNLQVPGNPNYSLVLYYASDRPIKKGSLLKKFVDGNDMFRDERFKIIPSIMEGYWMVKRAVGSKACLLGKAVKCNYLRQDNFLEIDVDIGSSSVARSIISLVLGYVTSIVVDLAVVIEAKKEEELPECILGTVRLNRVRPDSAVQI